MPVNVVLGSKTLEVRPSSADKGSVARAIIKDIQTASKEEYEFGGKDIDFMLCIGDGKTDEAVFAALDEFPFRITSTVGKKQTKAQYYLDTVDEVKMLLSYLGDISEPVQDDHEKN